MEFLILMKLQENGIGETPEENKRILEQKIIPSIEMLIRMEGEGMLSGGFMEGQRSAAFVVSVESEDILDDTLSQLPCGDIFGMEVVQLEGLKEALKRDREALKTLTGK